MTATSGRIDVHFHSIPEFFRDAVLAAGRGPTVTTGFPAWTAQSAIELMDRHGIAVALLSISQPGVHFGDDAKARALARRGNEYHAELAARWRGRFGKAIIAAQVSSRFPHNHGAPIHIGDPAAIGADLEHPLFGGKVPPIPPGLVCVFWACGKTPQQAALEAKVEFMITHAPAHGFITDLEADKFCIP
jgi:hypothetical protein